MITDKTIAVLVMGLYAYPGTPPIEWDHYDPGSTFDGVCWARKRLGDVDVVVLRGSTTRADWIHDAETWAAPMEHQSLGDVHYGFSVGMDRVFGEVLDQTAAESKVIVAGHSLGAGRAAILTGLMCASTIPPIARVVFGEPRPGYARLGEIIKDVPARSYRNIGAWGHDLVTDVPYTLPEFPFVHPTPLTDIDQAPDAALASQWSIFAGHHMGLYATALATTAATIIVA